MTSVRVTWSPTFAAWVALPVGGPLHVTTALVRLATPQGWGA